MPICQSFGMLQKLLVDLIFAETGLEVWCVGVGLYDGYQPLLFNWPHEWNWHTMLNFRFDCFIEKGRILLFLVEEWFGLGVSMVVWKEIYT